MIDRRYYGDGFSEIMSYGLTEEEFIKVKRFIKTQRLFSYNDVKTMSDKLMRMAFLDGAQSPDREDRIVEEMNLDDMNKTIRSLLVPQKMGLALIGDCSIEAIVKTLSV